MEPSQEKPLKTKVIYHAGCHDGFFAAWLFWLVDSTVLLHPASYGDEPPEVFKDEKVFIVDFSYPAPVLEEMRKKCHSLLVMDHHKNVSDECKKLPYFTFDNTKSGASLAWDYLRASLAYLYQYHYTLHSNIAKLVSYVEDRDLWNNRLENTKAINAAIRSYPMDLNVWFGLASRLLMMSSLKEDGEAILRYRKILIDQHVRHANEITVAGHKVLGVYCSVDVASEVGEALCSGDNANRPFGVTWFDIPSTQARVYSLRSRGDFNVGQLAKQFGGGGHDSAAGFTIRFTDGLAPFDASVTLKEQEGAES